MTHTILFYIPSLSDTGGGQHALTLLSCELVARGYEVRVFTRPPFSPAHRYVTALRRAGVPIEVLPRLVPSDFSVEASGVSALPRGMRVAAFAVAVAYLCARFVRWREAWTAGVSIVMSRRANTERARIRERLNAALPPGGRSAILHVWGPAVLTPVLLDWARARHVPAIYHEMGEADQPYLEAWSDALTSTLPSIGTAAAIICSSPTVEQSIRSVYRYAGPVATIPFMIAAPQEPPQSPQGGFVVGTIGRLVPHKRHADLIQAVRLLRDRQVDVKLLIAGSGPLRGDLERLCAAAGVAEHVEFLGEFEQLSDVMRRFHVLAIASSSESQSMPVIEAMAYGKPAVVTAIGGMPDFVEDGVTGFVVPVGDPDSLAAALRRFADDPALVEQMGRAAHERYLERCQPSQIVAAVERVYQAIAAEDGGAGALMPFGGTVERRA